MKRLLSALFALVLSTAALAQSQTVRQSGTVTGRHLACWLAPGVIQDCGTIVTPFATTFGTVGQGLTICANSAATTGPYNQLCIGANTSGAAQISLQNVNGAVAQDLEFNINGSIIPFPSTLTGSFVTATGSVSAGSIPAFTGSGYLTHDSGLIASGGNITSGTWAGTAIAIATGGTGATTASGARTALGLGTIATQDSSAVAITGGTITGMPNPSANSDVANKSYVDSFAQGLTIIGGSRLATAAVLPNSPTYSNGASGVGATLTAGSNTTLTVDGTVAALNDVVIVKNQASTFQNGQYYVSTAGSGAAAWVLTRCTTAACGVQFNTAATMLKGSYSFISAGSANINTSWVLAATVATVGTDAATFTLFSSQNLSLASGSIFVGNGSNVATATAPAAGVITWIQSATSANLAAAVTDETGSGSLVFGTAPQLSLVGIGAASNGANSIYLKQPNDTTMGVRLERFAVDSALFLGYRTGGLPVSAQSTFQINASFGSTGAFEPITLITSDTERMRIAANGDVSFPALTCSGTGGTAVLSATGVLSCSTSSASVGLFPVTCASTTGSVDCTTAIQTQITACEAAKGGVVVLQGGTLLVKNGLVLAGGCTIQGQGWQYCPSNCTAFTIPTTGTYIKQTNNATFTASISTTNMTVSAVAAGTLLVGDTVSGAGVTLATTIVSQTSGSTGGTGVYVVSASQTVGSVAMMTARPVFTINGPSAIENLAITQTQPADTPGWTVSAANGNLFPPVIQDTGGSNKFSNINLYGVTKGIVHASSNFIHNAGGSCFTWCHNVVFAADIIRWDSGMYHAYFIGSNNTNMLSYIQGNSVVFRLERMDTPFIHQQFIFGFRMFLQIVENTNGTTTKFSISDIDCDSCNRLIAVSGIGGGNTAFGNATNMSVQGAGSGSSGITCSQTCTIDMANLRIQGVKQAGMQFAGGNSDVSVTNLRILDCNQDNAAWPPIEVDSPGAAVTLGGRYQATVGFCTTATPSGPGLINSSHVN